jgi:AcrR family transcriptional regulator
MVTRNPRSPSSPPSRERILDAAERLLATGSAAFSMRELAAEAQLSFATPFNQFGSKSAIILALSARRIELMSQRVAKAPMPSSAVARVRQGVKIAARVMLEAPAVNRAVMGAISSPGDRRGDVASQSAALWARVLGTGAGLCPRTRPLGLAILPEQLAIVFRGVLSFWTAGEIPDEELVARARGAAAAVLLGFVDDEQRVELLADLEGSGNQLA